MAALVPELRDKLAKLLESSAMIDPLRLQQMAKCNHTNRTGGNDYHLCHDCDLMWDYRRESAQDKTISLLLDALTQLQADLEQGQSAFRALQAQRDELEAEVTHLREERDALQAWRNSHGPEAFAALQVEVGRLQMDRHKAEATIAKQQETIRQLKPFVKHSSKCAGWSGVNWRDSDAAICNCGLAALLRVAGEK